MPIDLSGQARLNGTMYSWALDFLVLLLLSAAAAGAETEWAGARRVALLNYTDCIELSNNDTTVVLGHQVGGRVLSYVWKGKEALYLDPKEADWTPDTPLNARVVSAGRFDIGPEYLIQRGLDLWAGEWRAEIIGDRQARLTSIEDPLSGVQLVREFTLDADSSHLACKQIIRNHSTEIQRWCHWSRTFAKHGGIAAIPLTPALSRMPNQYVMVHGPRHLDPKPEDSNIRVREHFLEVLAPPAHPKLGLDSYAGWFAYVTPDNLAFVKSYQTQPDKPYNELAGYTISIWYPKASRIAACELEPIGPANVIEPGEAMAFTEHWRLIEFPFPNGDDDLDLQALSRAVHGH